MTYFLEPMIQQQDAVRKMSDHLHSSWLKKLKKTKQLTSIERIYLPFWCFDYRLVSHALPDGMEGRIAIEPLSNMNAILPVDYEIQQTDQSFQSVQKPLEDSAAQEVLYWELFAKEKRREKIDVSITNRFVLYVPYWVGYIKDKDHTYDVLAVDGLNGKVDVPMKETVLSYLCEDQVNTV